MHDPHCITAAIKIKSDNKWQKLSLCLNDFLLFYHSPDRAILLYGQVTDPAFKFAD